MFGPWMKTTALLCLCVSACVIATPASHHTPSAHSHHHQQQQQQQQQHLHQQHQHVNDNNRALRPTTSGIALRRGSTVSSGQQQQQQQVDRLLTQARALEERPAEYLLSPDQIAALASGTEVLFSFGSNECEVPGSSSCSEQLLKAGLDRALLIRDSLRAVNLVPGWNCDGVVDAEAQLQCDWKLYIDAVSLVSATGSVTMWKKVTEKPVTGAMTRALRYVMGKPLTYTEVSYVPASEMVDVGDEEYYMTKDGFAALSAAMDGTAQDSDFQRRHEQWDYIYRAIMKNQNKIHVFLLTKYWIRSAWCWYEFRWLQELWRPSDGNPRFFKNVLFVYVDDYVASGANDAEVWPKTPNPNLGSMQVLDVGDTKVGAQDFPRTLAMVKQFIAEHTNDVEVMDVSGLGDDQEQKVSAIAERILQIHPVSAKISLEQWD